MIKRMTFIVKVLSLLMFLSVSNFNISLFSMDSPKTDSMDEDIFSDGDDGGPDIPLPSRNEDPIFIDGIKLDETFEPEKSAYFNSYDKKAFKQLVDGTRKFEEETSFAGADLGGMNLDGLDAPKCDFSGANMKGVSCCNVNIPGAIMDETILINTIFENSNLSKVKISGKAPMVHVIFDDVKAQEISIVDREVISCIFKKSDLSFSRITPKGILDSLFKETNMTLVDMHNVPMHLCVFSRITNTLGWYLHNAQISDSTFYSIIFTEVDMTDLHLLSERSPLVIDQCEFIRVAFHRLHITDIAIKNSTIWTLEYGWRKSSHLLICGGTAHLIMLGGLISGVPLAYGAYRNLYSSWWNEDPGGHKEDHWEFPSRFDLRACYGVEDIVCTRGCVLVNVKKLSTEAKNEIKSLGATFPAEVTPDTFGFVAGAADSLIESAIGAAGTAGGVQGVFLAGGVLIAKRGIQYVYRQGQV